MRGVCFDAVEAVSCHELPDPKIVEATDAIVRVEVAGLCGSDLHPYFGREVGLDPGTVMGHEFVGQVIEVGPSVRTIQTGDRVFAPFTTNCGECYFCRAGLTCRCVQGQLFGWRHNGRGLHGGQAQFVRVPLADGTLKKVPETLTADQALLLGDNFSTGYFAAELADVQPGGVYAVVGCGTVGLLAILAAKMQGAETVFAFDPVPERRRHAELLGAHALAPDAASVKHVQQSTGGHGVDGVMELVGLPDAQRLTFELIRPGGILSVVGCHCGQHFAFSPVEAYDKNITFKTGRCPARYYMEALTDRVVAGQVDLSGFITHRFPLADGQRAYRVFSQREEGCLKAVIEMG